MKKKKISIALIITLLVTSFATAEENFFSCSLGLSSGIPIYGSSSLSDEADKISTDSRIIAGAFLNLNLNHIRLLWGMAFLSMMLRNYFLNIHLKMYVKLL